MTDVVNAQGAAQPAAREEAPEGAGGILLPCARCGGPGKMIHPMGEYVGKGLGEDGGYYGPKGSRITCQSPASVCCDTTPSFHGPDQDKRAVAAWNRRAQQPADDAADLFKALRDESWDLRCFNLPTGGGDFDIGWRVVGHWQAEPCERTIAEVFSDDPAEAVRQALAALKAERAVKFIVTPDAEASSQ